MIVSTSTVIPVERPQRAHLVVHEPAEGGSLRRRPHVRDDERVDRRRLWRRGHLPPSNRMAASRSVSQRIPPISPGSPVAVFDSGVGGLTVLHELLVSLPAEDYLYLGDTAHFPYGDRSDAELQEFSLRIAEHLLVQGAKLLVVACNSASAAAFETLERWLERSCPRDRRDRGVAPGGAARGGRDPQRQDRPARDAGDSRQRRLRARDRGRRPARAPGERRVPGSRADHPVWLPVR